MLKQSALTSKKSVELKINTGIFIDSCHHKKEERLINRISLAGYEPVFDIKEEYSALRKRFKDMTPSPFNSIVDHLIHAGVSGVAL
jgi:hypothetical protein